MRHACQDRFQEQKIIPGSMQGLVVAYRIDVKRCVQQAEHEHHGSCPILVFDASEMLIWTRCSCRSLLTTLDRILVCALLASLDPGCVESVQHASEAELVDEHDAVLVELLVPLQAVAELPVAEQVAHAVAPAQAEHRSGLEPEPTSFVQAHVAQAILHVQLEQYEYSEQQLCRQPAIERERPRCRHAERQVARYKSRNQNPEISR